MKEILILRAVRDRPIVAVVSMVAIFVLTPLIQNINTPLAFEIWFRDLHQKPLNSALYIVFSILFGMFISLYLFTRTKCLDCKKNNGAKSGFVGSLIGFFIGICPACFSLIGFLLPLTTSILLTAYAPVFTSFSIGIMLFSIFKMGGFNAESQYIHRTNR